MKKVNTTLEEEFGEWIYRVLFRSGPYNANDWVPVDDGKGDVGYRNIKVESMRKLVKDDPDEALCQMLFGQGMLHMQEGDRCGRCEHERLR